MGINKIDPLGIPCPKRERAIPYIFSYNTMSRSGHYAPLRRQPGMRGIPRGKLGQWGIMAALVFGSNFATHKLFNTASGASVVGSSTLTSSSSLYLMDQARLEVPNAIAFEQRVRAVAQQLGIPAEWLMAVMYQESRFKSGVANYQGSGAVGLIQFMPSTAVELHTTTEALRYMDPVQQLDYVHAYLQQVVSRYGQFQSLTDLYLGILYPKARNQDYCFTLYAHPSVSYKQNKGLDEDQDGRVTVSDVDRHLQRRYPEAFMAKVG